MASQGTWMWIRAGKGKGKNHQQYREFIRRPLVEKLKAMTRRFEQAEAEIETASEARTASRMHDHAWA